MGEVMKFTDLTSIYLGRVRIMKSIKSLVRIRLHTAAKKEFILQSGLPMHSLFLLSAILTAGQKMLIQ